MVLNLGELLTAGLLFSALSFAAAVGLAIARNLRRREPSGPALMASLGVYTIATLATLVLTGSSWEALVPPALGWTHPQRMLWGGLFLREPRLRELIPLRG